MYPTILQAKQILKDAHDKNPGPWREHSIVAAKCARAIADKTAHLIPEKAYVLGLLHDIGRYNGVYHFKHIVDGYDYMMSLGYDEVARVCVSHSFSTRDISHYIGKVDVDKNDYLRIKDIVVQMVYDDYDLLIQLCDSLAGTDGAIPIEVRIADVKRRYGGNYPQAKIDRAHVLKHYFDDMVECDIYQLF